MDSSNFPTRRRQHFREGIATADALLTRVVLSTPVARRLNNNRLIMSDLKKILSRLEAESEEDTRQLTEEESQGLEGGVLNSGCPLNSGCHIQVACTG
jgi:hypothetical protein